jgi:UDP-glucose 4-epimerase
VSAPAPSRRILVTGLSTYWGGRLAQALEAEDDVETVIGVAAEDPTLELQRTEFVRVGLQHALLRRIVHAAEIDTVVDTRLIVDSRTAPARVAHEANVIGTMNILAACGGPDSPVRKVVFKSSAHYYGCERDDPSFFTEGMRRPHPPRTRLESDIVEADDAVRGFAERNPGVTVTTLRFANGLGPDIRTSHTDLLSLPVVPGILGFDPRYQFIHEDDIVGALRHAVTENLEGIYNAAADGVLVLSEVASLLGKPFAPVLPPWGTGLAASGWRALGIRVPDEVRQQMRYGRGIDNRRLKGSGYRFSFTTREAVQRFGEHLRVAHLRDGAREPYRYEREVEEFLRWSPSVRRANEEPPPREKSPG